MRRPNMPPPEISQASTADIAFLLLIFFISTTVFETEFGMQLTLPGLGGERVKVARKNVLTIRAAADGSILIDDTPVTLRDVRARVKSEKEANPNLIVTIQTDGEAPYSRMIDVLDEVQMAGAERISIRKR